MLDKLAGQSPGDDGITCYYVSNWSKYIRGFSSYQEREENEIQCAKKEKKEVLKDIYDQFNL